MKSAELLGSVMVTLATLLVVGMVASVLAAGVGGLLFLLFPAMPPWIVIAITGALYIALTVAGMVVAYRLYRRRQE